LAVSLRGSFQRCSRLRRAPSPRINGPGVFGVRPGSAFLYTIPATGDRPIAFSADNLPVGLKLDAATGHITGEVVEKGTYSVVLRATNALGAAEKKIRIVVGDQIALTIPGRDSARAISMVSSPMKNFPT
jgi:alpha-galactosidase